MSIQLIIKLKAPRKTSHIHKASAQLSHLKYQRPVPNSALAQHLTFPGQNFKVAKPILHQFLVHMFCGWEHIYIYILILQ